MFKYLFTVAAAMGGIFSVKICFVKRERSWPPVNRPQSLGLVLVESSAPGTGSNP